MPSDVKCRKKEKRNHKEHHKKASFFHIAEFSNGFFFVLFLRKRILRFLCYLFIYEKVQVKLSETAVRRCFSKYLFLNISQCSQKTPAFEFLFNKAGALKACIFIRKEIPTQFRVQN